MISIVIPVLNEEELLPACLRSLRNQDYPGEYEIIVVDNGSTDNTVSIAREFGVRVIFSPTPRNIFAAREYGAWAANGEILVQADADTIYPRDWLTRIAEYFVSHPKVVALAGDFTYQKPMRWSIVESFLRRLCNFLTILFWGRPFVISGANFAFRKEAFLKVNGYDRSAYAPDQYSIAARLSKIGKIVYDRKLKVATSPRKFQKPALLLIILALLNWYRGATHLVKDYVAHSLLADKRAFKRRAFIRVPPVMLAILGISLVSVGYFSPSSQLFGKVYYKGETEEKVVALTFDDGPNEPYTSQILDILAVYGINATFFTTGCNVELYPETARRIMAEGHVLGNHSYSHDDDHALSQQGSLDIKLAQEAIFRTVGVKPHLYRPPDGKKSPWELQYLKSENMIEVTWSVSADESPELSAELVAQEVVEETEPGSIILLHDGYENYHNIPEADRTLTVEALPIMIASLQEKGYRFVTVPELLGVPAYN